jgi:phosphonate dehydrogenase
VIVVTNPVHDAVRKRLAEYGDVVINDSATPWSDAEVRERARNADALMGFMTDRIDAELLTYASRLQIVAAALKGFDSYDVDACTEAGVWLTIVPDLLTEPTAELAIGLAISIARHVRPGDEHIRSGQFEGWRSHFFGLGLRDSTVAVVGLGCVGRAIVDRLRGFACKEILGVDPVSAYPNTTPCELYEAFSRADFVFLAVPLSPHSHQLVGSKTLAHAKSGQYVINIGRGSVVDEAAVLSALESSVIAGYAADVFACEDWSLPSRPTLIDPRLLAHPNTLFTPHLGSAVRDVRLAIEHRAASNIIAVLQGQVPPDPINHVDPVRV